MNATDKSDKNRGAIKEFQDFVDSTSDFLKRLFPLVYNFTTNMRDKIKKRRKSKTDAKS